MFMLVFTTQSLSYLFSDLEVEGQSLPTEESAEDCFVTNLQNCKQHSASQFSVVAV